MNRSNAAGSTPEDQTSHSGGPVTSRAEWCTVLRAATLEVFSTMVGVTLDTANVPHQQIPDPGASDTPAYVTGMIGIAGAMRAVFTLRCSDRVAIAITSKMLDISLDQAAGQSSDAVGEVCNMIAGDFKHKIGYGATCNLTVPTVVMGGNYVIHCLEKGERIEFPVTCEGETLLVTLDVRG